jgi:hypothetical protein
LEKSHQTAAGMASIFPNRFCSNSLTHPGHFYFGFRVQFRVGGQPDGMQVTSLLIVSSIFQWICSPNAVRIKFPAVFGGMKKGWIKRLGLAAFNPNGIPTCGSQPAGQAEGRSFLSAGGKVSA